MALTKNINYFQDLISEHGDSIHYYICSFLNYEKHDTDEFVLNIDEIGEKFYIILSGSVRVITWIKGEMTPVAVLSNGRYFGEVALTNDVPRNASIQCVTPSHFLTLDRESYKNSFGQVVASQIKKSVKFLKSIPLFKDWTSKSI